MSTATAEAPIIPAETHISGQETNPQEQQAFNDIFKNPDKVESEQPKKSSERPKKATETPSEASKPSESDKVAKEPSKPSKEAAKGQKDDKATSKRWEKLGELKTPEVIEEEPEAEEGSEAETSQSTEDDEQAPEGKNAQSRWMQLKAAEKELLSIKPSFEELKKKIEGYETNGNIPEEVKKKLDRYEQRYAEELLDSDEGFQSGVMQPISKAWSDIGDVAREAGLDSTSAQALANSVRELSGVSRSLAIRRIIAKGTMTEDGESVPLPDETIATLSQLAISAANDLHNIHWPKEAQKRHEARELALSIRGKEVQETESEKSSREGKYSDEAKRISAIIKDKMPMVFEQHPDALEAIMSARPSTDVADQVFDAQAGHMVNFMAKTINDLMTKLSKAEASLKAREKAKPGSNDGRPAATKREDVQPSFEEVFGVRR